MYVWLCSCFKHNKVTQEDVERVNIEADLKILKDELENMKIEIEDKKLDKLEMQMFEEVMKDPLYKHLAINTETVLTKQEENTIFDLELDESINEVSEDETENMVDNSDQVNIIVTAQELEKIRNTSTSESEKEWLQIVSAAEVPSPRTTLKLQPAKYQSPDDSQKASPSVSFVSIASDNDAVPAVPEKFEQKTNEAAFLHSAKDLEKKNVFIFSKT
jgi:hypothetical protein